MDNQNTAPAASPIATSPAPGITNAPSLENVEGGYVTFIRKRWWAVIIAIVLAVAVSFVNPFFCIVILVFAISLVKFLYENALFKAFAATNNFSYQKKSELLPNKGIIFGIGHSQKYEDVVDGMYKKWPLSLFLYGYTIGYGRDSHRYDRAVLSINFSTSSPAFVLRRHSVLQILKDEGESLKQNGYSQEVNLEGDFSKHFNVYIRPNTQDDVLSILTPDKMEVLKALDKYELELTENGFLYVYCHGYITKKKNLIDMFSIVEAIIPKIGMDVDRERVIQNIQQDAANTTAPSAS